MVLSIPLLDILIYPIQADKSDDLSGIIMDDQLIYVQYTEMINGFINSIIHDIHSYFNWDCGPFNSRENAATKMYVVLVFSVLLYWIIIVCDDTTM